MRIKARASRARPGARPLTWTGDPGERDPCTKHQRSNAAGIIPLHRCAPCGIVARIKLTTTCASTSVPSTATREFRDRHHRIKRPGGGKSRPHERPRSPWRPFVGGSSWSRFLTRSPRPEMGIPARGRGGVPHEGARPRRHLLKRTIRKNHGGRPRPPACGPEYRLWLKTTSPSRGCKVQAAPGHHRRGKRRLLTEPNNAKLIKNTGTQRVIDAHSALKHNQLDCVTPSFSRAS